MTMTLDAFSAYDDDAGWPCYVVRHRGRPIGKVWSDHDRWRFIHSATQVQGILATRELAGRMVEAIEIRDRGTP
jgi:hypothetical protein